MTTYHDFGDLIVQRASFTNKAGTLTDPTSVFGSYLKSDGTEVLLQYGVDANLVKISTGIYDLQIDVDVDSTGTWRWRIWGTGTIQSAEEGQFNILQRYTDIPADTITAENMVDTAKSPKRVTTDEGTVEERSIHELIAADQHQASKEAPDAPLHGLRISRAKPGGAV